MKNRGNTKIDSGSNITPASQNIDLEARNLSFRVGGKLYGVSINHIKEIIEHGRFTRVPLCDTFIRGVINLRGYVVPVIDLAARLGKQSQPISKRTCIVIIEIPDEDGEKVDLGVVVDAVDEVLDLQDIEAAPDFGLDIRQDFIKGMGRLQDGTFIELLDVYTVLSVAELSAFYHDGATRV